MDGQQTDEPPFLSSLSRMSRAETAPLKLNLKDCLVNNTFHSVCFLRDTTKETLGFEIFLLLVRTVK